LDVAEDGGEDDNAGPEAPKDVEPGGPEFELEPDEAEVEDTEDVDFLR
jgi:hypothetical protein